MMALTWTRGGRLLAVVVFCASASLAAEAARKPEREAVAPWMAAALAEVEAAKAAVAKAPKDWQAHVRHGDALARVRVWEEAEAAYCSADVIVRGLADLDPAEKRKVADKLNRVKEELDTIEWAQKARPRLTGRGLNTGLYEKLRALGAGFAIDWDEEAGTIVGVKFWQGGPRSFAALRGLPIRSLYCAGMTADDLLRLPELELSRLIAHGLKADVLWLRDHLEVFVDAQSLEDGPQSTDDETTAPSWESPFLALRPMDDPIAMPSALDTPTNLSQGRNTTSCHTPNGDSA